MNRYFEIWTDISCNSFNLHGWIFRNWVDLTIEIDYEAWERLKDHQDWIKRAYQISSEIKPPYKPTYKPNLDDIPF